MSKIETEEYQATIYVGEDQSIDLKVDVEIESEHGDYENPGWSEIRGAGEVQVSSKDFTTDWLQDNVTPGMIEQAFERRYEGHPFCNGYYGASFYGKPEPKKVA